MILISLFSKRVFAAQETDALREFSKEDEIWEMIPENIDKEKLEITVKEENGNGILSFLFSEILDYFSLSLKNGVVFFGSVCALILIAAFFRSIKESFHSAELEKVFDWILFLGLALILYAFFSKIIDSVLASLGAIRNFFLSSLPITCFLLALSGSVTQSSILAANLSQTLALATTLTSNFLAPTLKLLFAFLVSQGFTDTGLGTLFDFLKRSVKTLCVLFFTLVGASLSLQNALATSADSLAQRSVRFAAGNFIPVVGGMVGQSIGTLSASFSVVKTECGVLCILLLLILILRPILTVCVHKIFLSLAAAVADLTGEKKGKTLLHSFRSLLDLLMALMISEGCYLIFYITLFLTNKGNF